jgi:hypothetical protein
MATFVRTEVSRSFQSHAASRRIPGVATWLTAAAFGLLAGAASAEATLPPVPITTAIVGAVDGNSGDTVLEPLFMIGAVIDPANAQAVDDGTDAPPELPVVVDDAGAPQ